MQAHPENPALRRIDVVGFQQRQPSIISDPE
jgi:hypothetical protein